MQRFSNVSFSKFEFEIAWAALAQASRLAGSGCMIRHYRGERRKEEEIFQTLQSAYLPFQPFAFSSVDNHVGIDG